MLTNMINEMFTTENKLFMTGVSEFDHQRSRQGSSEIQINLSIIRIIIFTNFCSRSGDRFHL